MSPLEPVTHAAIARIIASRAPQEAVGMLWRRPGEPEIVLELSNISDEPTTSYAVRVNDILKGIELLLGDDIGQTFDPGDLVVWHSHPSGSVGPSRGDMRARLEDLTYMVVSPTPDGDLVVTEF